MTTHKGSLLGATLLVAGTSIGGGMLALPVATGAAGFIPSLVMMLLGWAFMTTTALFFSEVNLWMERDAHVITMAQRFLGPVGKGAAWLLYLFIGYASLVAYTAGGGELLAAGLKGLGYTILKPWDSILFVALFGSVLYLGNVILGRINAVLMMGLVASYILLIGAGAQGVRPLLLLRQKWGEMWIAVPLLLTIFSFQTIIPSLTIYLKQDAKRLRKAIILGTSLTLVIYLIWQVLILGTVLYEGEMGLGSALAEGRPITEFLAHAAQSRFVGLFADFFAFFALVTSFLGIALGLFDFLADGLKIKKAFWGKLTLGLLVALPTLFFTLTMERVFLRALDSSGGIGDALLNGLFPALMLYIGRYRHHLHSDYRIPGGKPLITFVILYALFVFTIEILGKFGCMRCLA